MNLLSGLTVKPLLWASGGLAALVLALSGALVVQNARHEAAIAKLEARNTSTSADLYVAKTSVTLMQASIDNLVSTTRQNQTVINDLARRLREAVGQAQAVEAINRTVTAERDAARSARTRAEATLQRERSRIYATDHTCAAWGARPVCGAISDSLFQQWSQASDAADPAGPDPDRAGRGGQAPAGADRPDLNRGAGAGRGPGAGDPSRTGLQPRAGVLQIPAARADAAGGAGLGRPRR